MLSPAEKMLFWTGIMRDHAEFLLLSLSSREKELVKTAQNFKDVFIDLRNEAQALMNSKSPGEMLEFTKKAEAVLQKYVEFKMLILRRQLQCNVEINLPPTFTNHMINEAGEFSRDIEQIQSLAIPDPTKENIMLHKIWLPDAAGHAATIAADLDPTEAVYIRTAQEFKKSFNDMYLKAIELGLQLERASLENGALAWFNLEVLIRMNEFIGFLDKVRELREKCQVLGSLNPLVPDHMMREEKYYLANVEALKR